MTVLLERQVDGPATHALVIGVGAYPHLVGGEGPLLPGHEGMGQLTSPPHSARAFAQWLLAEYRNPDKPLASLDLLLSDAQSNDVALPGGDVVEVERARMAAVKPAVKAWKARGDSSRDNLILLYFCGHGIASGTEMALLLEDYGKDPDNPLEGAIDFRNLHLGMNKCQARLQCYFIDACRAYSRELLQSWRFGGDPIIYGLTTNPVPGNRHAPAYFSTVAGSRSYGREGAPSVFTEALLKALAGAGSDDWEGDWRIYTDRLNVGITHLVERMVGPAGLLDQVSSTDSLTRFTLHYLEGPPIVPVVIGCQPAEANAVADLSYGEGAARVPRDERDASDWYVEMAEGRYRFAAAFSQGPFHDQEVERPVRPAFRLVRIEV